MHVFKREKYRKTFAGLLNITGDDYKDCNVAQVNNAGTVNWTGRGSLNCKNVFNNTGTFNALAETSYFGASNGGFVVFNNSGLVVRSGGNGLFSFNGDDNAVYFDHYDGAFNNTGRVKVQTGTLQIGSGLSTGTFNVLEGARLNINDSQQLDSTPLSGAGTYSIEARPQARGNITLDGGTLELNKEIFYGGFGEEGSTATLTGTGKFAWNGGSMNGNWTIDSGIRTTLSGDARKEFSGNFKNKGVFNWLGGGPLATNNSTFINAGTYNVKAAGTFCADTYINSTTFENRGTLNTFAGESVMDNTSLINKGLLNIGGDGGIGTLRVDYYHLQPGSITRMEFGGTSPESHDRFTNYHGYIEGTLDVRLVNSFKPLDHTFTVATGSYLAAFPVVVKPEGYITQTSGTFGNSYLRIGKPHKITGRAFKTLTNGVQKGIAGVTITRTEGDATQTTTTDSNGFYKFRNLFAGTHSVSASKTGVVFDPVSKSVTLPTTGKPFSPNGKANFQTYGISGRVVNGNGKPIVGVTINLAGAVTKTAITNEQGAFAFNNLGVGTYQVVPAAQSGFIFAPQLKTIVLPKTKGNSAPNGIANFTRANSPASGAASSARNQ